MRAYAHIHCTLNIILLKENQIVFTSIMISLVLKAHFSFGVIHNSIFKLISNLDF